MARAFLVRGGGVDTINNTMYDLYGWGRGQSNVKTKLVRQSIHIYECAVPVKALATALSISFNFNSTNKHLVSLQQIFTLKA